SGFRCGPRLARRPAGPPLTLLPARKRPPGAPFYRRRLLRQQHALWKSGVREPALPHRQSSAPLVPPAGRLALDAQFEKPAAARALEGPFAGSGARAAPRLAALIPSRESQLDRPWPGGSPRSALPNPPVELLPCLEYSLVRCVRTGRPFSTGYARG